MVVTNSKLDDDGLTEYLTHRDLKFLALSFTAITTATVLGLYIYYNIIKKEQTSQSLLLHNSSYNSSYNSPYNPLYNTPYNPQGVLKNMTDIIKPELKLEIITCEYYDNDWHETLKHTFYGNTEQDIEDIIDAHRQTDAFFDASFSGAFNWEGGTIILKNDISEIEQNI